jgi:hypothetical protein
VGCLPRADPGSRQEPKSLLDFRPVLANRDALVLIFGYAAAIWDSVGLRQWIVVFLAFCAADQAGVPAQAWTALGALIGFLGVPAGLLGNELSIPYRLRPIATLVFLLSALTGGLFGFAAALPYIAVLCLSVVVGFIVQGIFPISLRVSSTSSRRGTEKPRSGCISASALAVGSSEHFSSASRSINSAGQRSSAPR